MERHVFGVIALAWLAAITTPAGAQTIRSGSGGSWSRASEAPPASPAPTSGTPQQDLFRATPETYAPRYDGAATADRHAPLGAGRPGSRRSRYGYDPGVLLHDAFPTPRHAATPPDGPPDGGLGARPAPAERSVPERPASGAPISERAPQPITTSPGLPKTFYVVDGCYAGDTPPRAAQLSPACRAERVRVVPPGAR